MRLDLFKGYIATKGKKSIEKIKGRSDWKTYDEVKGLPEFAGILADDVILIDIDDLEQSETLMRIVEDLQLDCRVYQTTRGRHFLFKNSQWGKCGTHKKLACGLTADIKVGGKNTYEVLKFGGEERHKEWEIEDDIEYQDVPKWLLPIDSDIDFLTLENGDGRNQTLFNYILTLQSHGHEKEEIRECLRLINKYILKDPLSDGELNTIMRDDSFQKPVFFEGKNFLFEKFAVFLKNNHKIVKINGQLHIFQEGAYECDYKKIEAIMIYHIPSLKKTQRKEVLDYIELIAETVEEADARYIGFRNGVYDIVGGELKPFSSDIVLTNKIPWDYSPTAYDELMDRTLDKLACDDKNIRALLEEAVGYCFYRRNELGKAFILTGDKSNGKSTYLDCLNVLLGEQNISSLDLKEMDKRFSTSMMFGKLANIGDDISDEFMSDTSLFKKVVTGNRIKAERKGQDPFEFKPYIKLLFAANEIPRMKDSRGAVLRRLVIVPFNARFSNDDPDYDPYIRHKLKHQEPIEYLIRLGIEGLHRVLEGYKFTKSKQVEQELQEYEEMNNPIIAFIHDCEDNDKRIEGEPVGDVYRRYTIFCAENGMNALTQIKFTKQIKARLGLNSKPARPYGKLVQTYMAIEE